jgi:hypothetical protein
MHNLSGFKVKKVFCDEKFSNAGQSEPSTHYLNFTSGVVFLGCSERWHGRRGGERWICGLGFRRHVRPCIDSAFYITNSFLERSF